MALPTETITLNNIAVAVWDSKLHDFITDNFFGTIPLFEKLYLNDKGSGSVIRFEGGRQIDTTILYNAPTTASYATGTMFDTNETQIVTDAIFQWKQVYTPVNISGLHLAQFSGGPEVKLIDYVETLQESAIQSHATAIDNMIFLDGTGNGGLNYDGLAEAVCLTAQYSTYGGITRSTTPGDPGNAINGYISTTGGPISKALLASAYFQTAYNKYKVDLIVTTRALFAELWDAVEGADRNYQGGALREVGFDTIRFNGAEVVYDDECPSGTCWGLNTKMMQLWFLSGRSFTRRSSQFGLQGGIPIANQDMVVDQLITYGNFIVNGPRYCFQLQNLT